MYYCRITHDVTFLILSVISCITSDIKNQLHSVASALNLSLNYIKMPRTNAVHTY